ncbi:hypothetical protein ACOTHJ_15450 [Achromobacter xylosoxidans]
MIDFKKLMDPEYMAEARAEREAEDRKQEEKDKEIRALVNKCLEHVESLPERERSFIRSCQHRINTYRLLTEPQEKWLRDIAGRL